MHVEQVQLDELYAVLRDLKAGEISEDERIKRLERSPYWVWTAMDPQSKLLLPVPEPTHGTGSAKMWHSCVPAMAAGLTDHVWTLKDVLIQERPPAALVTRDTVPVQVAVAPA
jgi:hypothetical protein